VVVTAEMNRQDGAPIVDSRSENGYPEVRKNYCYRGSNTVKLHQSGLSGAASHPDMQKILIIGFFFENKLHWQFAVRLLLFTVCTAV